MKLYEVEVGATYWVAAENIQNAINAMWGCWEVEGSLEDALTGDYLHIDEVSLKRAATLHFRDDCAEHAGRLMVDVAKECAGTEVIACSEWP